MKFNKNKKSNIYIIRGLDSNSIGEKKKHNLFSIES